MRQLQFFRDCSATAMSSVGTALSPMTGGQLLTVLHASAPVLIDVCFACSRVQSVVQHMLGGADRCWAGRQAVVLPVLVYTLRGADSRAVSMLSLFPSRIKTLSLSLSLSRRTFLHRKLLACMSACTGRSARGEAEGTCSRLSMRVLGLGLGLDLG